ncbi:septal ring lytic transglycosylase RlpA family protein [Alkalispirochaeta alkalica]|uniref:septal ring lytic transglycosylase RlpA family protein n=1 Tax=Alkalispirochaeta alkalica TaxID=46356 RepID=UPI000B95B1FC|nr:septal ring lytic transglycosylase RlpA family protein [Alkalispirochaeta alkalica]
MKRSTLPGAVVAVLCLLGVPGLPEPLRADPASPDGVYGIPPLPSFVAPRDTAPPEGSTDRTRRAEKNVQSPVTTATGDARDAGNAGTVPQDRSSGESPRPSRDYQLQGVASWYGGKFQGRLTANGEVFDTHQISAAHRELPFGTIVRVTNQTNGKSVDVRINDRGPFVDNRVIDLSRAAADAIDMTSAGIAPVNLEILHYEPECTLRTVQIASFSSPAGARNLLERLSRAGLAPAIEDVPDQNIYRVIIPAVPEEDLPEIRRRLASVGHQNVLIRRHRPQS